METINGISAECQSGMCYDNCIHGMEALQRKRRTQTLPVLLSDQYYLR